MTSDSVLAISVSVAVTVKGGGGVRNHVYVSINKKKCSSPVLTRGCKYPRRISSQDDWRQVHPTDILALFLSRSIPF